MASTAIRERRRTLRWHLLVRQMVQMKIKARSLLMEAGVSYNKQRLHKAGYFRELLATNPDIDEGLGSLLRLCRETVVRLGKTESATKVFFPSCGLERHSSSCAPQKVCVPSIGCMRFTWPRLTV